MAATFDSSAEGSLPLSERLDQPKQLHLPPAPSFEVLNRTLNRVIERYDLPASVSASKALDYLERFLKKVLTQDWAKTPLSFVTQVATFAFSKEFREVSRFQPVRLFLIAEIRASTRAAFLNPMVRVYIDSFEPGSEHSSQLADALQSVKARIGMKWQDLLAAVPEFFRPTQVVGHVADLMIKMDSPWHELRALGLRQPHAPGLMDYVHEAFVDLSKADLTSVPAIERMLGWLKPDGQALRRVGAGATITALLWPWKDKQPSSEVSMLLIDRLTEFYGHPKASRDAAWNEVDPALERVFMRWLMKADFRFLFRVLREVEPSHMFPDREAFWRSLLEAGAVDELWVAFKPEGYRAALAKLPMDMRQSGRRFGLQTGEKDKSLLLMRIGNKIVVEGTHNFKVHFFDAAAKTAPKLYQPKYDVSEIRYLPNLDSFAHLGDWQTKARLRLAR